MALGMAGGRRVSERPCACGCGRPVASRTYFEGRCRQRVYRRKLAQAAGLPSGASLTLQNLQTGSASSPALRDAPARARKRRTRRERALRLSLPSVEVARRQLALLEQLGDELEPTREAIRRALRRKEQRAA
jgi:hypothetical protein